MGPLYPSWGLASCVSSAIYGLGSSETWLNAMHEPKPGQELGGRHELVQRWLVQQAMIRADLAECFAETLSVWEGHWRLIPQGFSGSF